MIAGGERRAVAAAFTTAAVLLAGGALWGAVTGTTPLSSEIRQRDQSRGGTDTAAVAPAAQAISQDFRSEHAHLSSVAVQLTALRGALPAGGRFRLQDPVQPGAPDLVSQPLSAADFSTDPYLTFHFPPQSGSPDHAYRLRIEMPDPVAATLAVAISPQDTYSAGSAILDTAPQPGDLAFRTFYTYSALDLLGDALRTLFTQAGLVLAVVAFLLLPGWALSALLGAGWTRGQRLLAAPALTLLAWPVGLLALWVVGVTGAGPALAWLLLASGAAVLAWPLAARCFSSTKGHADALSTPNGAVAPLPPVGAEKQLPPETVQGADVSTGMDQLYWGLLAALFLITLLSRLGTSRDLVAGMGLDAYHHTLVTQLFLDRGGVPRDYAPYAPLVSFTYHFGFHAWAAALGWLAPGGLPVERLMPVAGQVGTALPVLTLALFGWRVLGNRWVGLVAGGLAGAMAVFPAFYVNWSRYTQGLGLALLPAAWVVLFDALAPVIRWRGGRTPDRTVGAGLWRVALGPLVLAAITSAGLFLTHYRIAGLFASYAALFLGLAAVGAWRQAARPERAVLGGAFVQNGLLVTAGAVVIVLPWLLNLRANFTTRFAGSPDPANAAYYDLRSMVGPVPPAYWSTGLLFALAVLGLVWCILRRDWPPVLLAVWFRAHLLWSNPTPQPGSGAQALDTWLWGNPTGLHLPGSGYLDTASVAISAFIPVCLLAAYPLYAAGAGLLRLARAAWAPVVRGVLATGGLAAAVLGAGSLLP
ncbi:MAG TPA: hypothetical protein VM536_15475, partial [Chloroflexia bacterium]|nr:hypothetical protein [Chloroflexia bacterium]